MWLIIIIAVIGCIAILASGCNTEADIKRITEFVFGPCDIKPYKKYSKDELKEMLGLVDKNIYLKHFSKGVMHRGEVYFYENKIESYEYKNGTHTCKITGTHDYDISLELDENGKLKNKSCTCQGFVGGYNCKHIFALLYKLKCAENKQKIIKNIETQIVPTSILMVKYFKDYCKKDLNLLNQAMLDNAVTAFDDAINEINNAAEELKLKHTEDTALNILKSIYDAVYDIRESIISILQHLKETTKTTIQIENNNKKDYGSLVTTMLIMDSLNKENTPVNKSPYSEKEMDYYGLDEFEKDLVRKGQYAPWDFEHEDTVEGDYYHYD